MEWGMQNFSRIEPLRPEFITHEGTKKLRSFVTGKPAYDVDGSHSCAFHCASGLSRIPSFIPQSLGAASKRPIGFVVAMALTGVTVGEYGSSQERFRLRTFILVCASSIAVVLGVIFWIRVLLVKSDTQHGGAIPVGWPDYITSILTSLEIQFMNASSAGCPPCVASCLHLIYTFIQIVYTFLARKLTDWENNKTQTDYGAFYLARKASKCSMT